MGTVKITRITNQNAQFYRTIGPYLSRRHIVTELGNPVWDDDGKEWFVAKVGRKIAGFAATRSVGRHVSLVSAYVVPEYRGQGVYSALILARLKAIGERHIKAVATPAAAKQLRKSGFRKIGERGKFSVMERQK